jgi:GR25 family glycosyltransferase involved in LPS biosynthesis
MDYKMDVRIVAITHSKTSNARLLNLKVQQERVKPYDLEIYNGINITSKEFKEFYDVECNDPGVKCLMYNTIQVLHQFLIDHQSTTTKYLIIVEDDVVFTQDFATKLQEVLDIWTTTSGLLETPSNILRIGFLPLVNKCGEWPIKDAMYAHTPFGSKLYFNLKQRCLGAQGVVYSKEGARIFLETFGGSNVGSNVGNSIKYSSIIEHVEKSKVNPVYGITRWSAWGPLKVPATDHLLNLESLGQAIVIPPLVIESQEGQNSSSCGSMKSVFIWAPLVEKGFVFS